MDVKHESDLTAKEKRTLEIEKIRNMTWKERLPYLWTYYKYWLLIALVAGMFLWVGITIYQNAQKIELLSIVVVDAAIGSEEGAEQLKSDLKQEIGTGDKHETVSMDISVNSGDDYASVMKRTVSLATGTSDVLICDEATYSEYTDKELFLDWREVLGEDYSKYEQYIVDGKLDLSQSQVWKDYGLVQYEPVYLGALAGTEHQDNIKGMVEYFY